MEHEAVTWGGVLLTFKMVFFLAAHFVAVGAGLAAVAAPFAAAVWFFTKGHKDDYVPKLTPAQKRVYDEVVSVGYFSCHNGYAPALALIAANLVDCVELTFGAIKLVRKGEKDD